MVITSKKKKKISRQKKNIKLMLNYTGIKYINGFHRFVSSILLHYVANKMYPNPVFVCIRSVFASCRIRDDASDAKVHIDSSSRRPCPSQLINS